MNGNATLKLCYTGMLRNAVRILCVYIVMVGTQCMPLTFLSRV